MARVRALESFAGLLGCMGAGQEADLDDETAAAMASEGYPVELVGEPADEPAADGSGQDPDRDAGPDGGGGDGDGGDDEIDGGDGDGEPAGA